MSSKDQPVLPTTMDPKMPSTSAADKQRGANRTSKTAQKLKALPDVPEPLTQSAIITREKQKQRVDEGVAEPDVPQLITAEEEEEEEDVEVYQQIAQIPEGTARADALRLNKKTIQSLPRVTAYCTASSFKFTVLLKFLKARKMAYGTNPRTFDDVIYTPYTYQHAPPRRTPSTARGAMRTGSDATVLGDLLGVPELVDEAVVEIDAAQNGAIDKGKQPVLEGNNEEHMADVFIFKYGTIVIWGMTQVEEQRFLSSIKRFEDERLAPTDVEMEDLHFYYASYSRIFNDVITLRQGSSYMTKLSLSHALAQSVKISLFESRIATAIEQTKDVPDMIASTGTIPMPHDVIMKFIGKVFLLRMDINRVGSMLGAPEIFWKFPELKPLYDAARTYLETNQRLEILNSRVDVLQDMLKLLKESVTSRHSERLEQIVIALIGIEIVLGVITICVDLFAPSLEDRF